MIIGVSGKPGTGKSHVVKYLNRKLKFKVIDSDKIRREILKDPKLQADLVTTFGRKILHKNGTIDHTKLLLSAGKDTLRLQVLGDYLDLKLGSEIRKLVGEEDTNYIIDTPNPLQQGITDMLDVSVLVITPKNNAIRRLVRRFPVNIINNILRYHKDVRNYDFVIDNRSSIQELKKDVDELFAEMLKMNKVTE